MKLAKAEEQLMNHIWDMDTAFMKDLIQKYPDPKPASTTIATLLKRMQDKGYVGYKTFGRSRQYYALIKKSTHFEGQFRGMLQHFFSNSAAQFASFFTRNTDLSKEELQELRKVIDQEIAKKK